MVVADIIPSASASQGFADLADLRCLLDEIDVGPLVEALTTIQPTGRRPFSRYPIVRAYLASYALGIPNTSALVRRLHNDPALRSVCEFPNRLPDRSTFSRVFQKIAQQHLDLVQECCARLSEKLAILLPGYGDEVAIDSTTIPAYANPQKAKDPDASWTKKNSAQDPKKEEWVYGYKAHVIADANHELPIAMFVTTAKRNDSPTLRPLIEQAEAEHDWFQLGASSVVIADRGYDSKPNNEYVHRRGAAPVIHKRKPTRGGKLHDGIYTTDGVPTCMGKKTMEFVKTDPQTGQHLYRCPAGGCARQRKLLGYAACGDESWEDPAQDIRLFGGKIRRASPEWKAKYKKRWSVERVFSRWKYPGRLEQHCYMGLAKVQLHAFMQMLVSLAEAAAKFPPAVQLRLFPDSAVPV